MEAITKLVSVTQSNVLELSAHWETVPATYKLVFYVFFVYTIYIGFDFYNSIVVPLVALIVRARIPERAKPLMTLTWKDKLYIAIAKLSTAVFVYHVYEFIRNTEISRMCVDFHWHTSSTVSSSSHVSVPSLQRSLLWLPLHLVLLFVIYDFFYTLFHWALHWPPIYPLIHKHHHRQMSPFRGSTDAINDNPIEYISGEYLHLLSLYLLTRMMPTGQVHALTAIVFIFIGGTLASLNHTRVNFHIPYMFNVNAHDYHHRQPRVNFGQYIMLWDWVFGTFQAEDFRHGAMATKQKKDEVKDDNKYDKKLAHENNNAKTIHNGDIVMNGCVLKDYVEEERKQEEYEQK